MHNLTILSSISKNISAFVQEFSMCSILGVNIKDRIKQVFLAGHFLTTRSRPKKPHSIAPLVCSVESCECPLKTFLDALILAFFNSSLGSFWRVIDMVTTYVQCVNRRTFPSKKMLLFLSKC